MQADYSGFARAAQINAQALSNLGEQIGEGIQKYQKNKQITATSLAQLEAISSARPEAYAALRESGGDVSKSISNIEDGDYKQKDVLSTLGALNAYVGSQDAQQQSRIRAAQLENLEARTAETRRKTTHPDPDKLTQAQNFSDRLGLTGKEREKFIMDQVRQFSDKPGVSVTVGGDDTPEIDPVLLTRSLNRDQEVLDEKIQPAINSLGTIQTMERLLKSGDVISGKIAKPELFMKAVAQDLGLGEFPDVATTEEYIANAGRQVGQIIKLFGAGTGLSDADREYAQQIAGGNISIPGDALIRIVKAARDTVEREVRAYDDRIRRRYGEGSGLNPQQQAFSLNSLSIEDMGSLFQNGGNQNGLTQPQIGGGSTSQTVDERRARLEQLRALKAAQGSQ
jgi:hypothetical protein